MRYETRRLCTADPFIFGNHIEVGVTLDGYPSHFSFELHVHSFLFLIFSFTYFAGPYNASHIKSRHHWVIIKIVFNREK